MRTKDIQNYYEEIKQIAYSIQTGATTAKVILTRLGSYARKNKVVQALSELGKIEKQSSYWTMPLMKVCEEQ
ncbi:Tn3 family transposase (plasmid) [Lactococcus lactis]|nr:Tn3 family transposase [Lactococcus lactis]WDA67352.1 Tn3 family transposase [Lactococcus lactis]